MTLQKCGVIRFQKEKLSEYSQMKSKISTTVNSGISEINWALIIKQLQKIRLLTFLRTQEYLEALITALFQNLSMNYFLRKIS